MQSFGFFYKKEKVQSFNKMHPVFSYSEKNPSNSQKNPENSKNYVIKKSKENIVVVVVREREAILLCLV